MPMVLPFSCCRHCGEEKKKEKERKVSGIAEEREKNKNAAPGKTPPQVSFYTEGTKKEGKERGKVGEFPREEKGKKKKKGRQSGLKF